MTAIRRLAAPSLAMLILVSCGSKENTAPAASAAPTPMNTPAAAPAAPAGSAAPTGAAPSSAAAAPAAMPERASNMTGTVIETMDASGYTYMNLKTASGDEWVAVPKTTVKKGDTVTVAGATMMGAFQSTTLNRKFDRIWFGTLAPAAAAAAPAGEPPLSDAEKKQAMAAQHAGVAKPQIDPGKIEVKKAEGGDGRTVAEVYAQRKALSGKSVAVRGKVVKVMNGIMGRNFIHLRDGSGSPEKGDNDLVVTSNEQAANGDTVLVKGKVAADRDFGSGYTYAVIVEEAKIAKDAK